MPACRTFSAHRNDGPALILTGPFLPSLPHGREASKVLLIILLPDISALSCLKKRTRPSKQSAESCV